MTSGHDEEHAPDRVPDDERDVEAVRERWDERYRAASGELWGRPPNQVVEAETADLTPGDVLDLGAGDGRNAVWLATRGHHVTAVDISPVALTQTRERAAELGVEVTTVQADLHTWTPEPDAADLVLLSFVQIPQPARGRMHRAAAAAVRPGGRLLLVAHDRANLEHGVGGPPDPSVLPNADEVRDEIGDTLTIDRCEIYEREVEGADRPALDLVCVAHRPA